jgi:hypothetical protein
LVQYTVREAASQEPGEKNAEIKASRRRGRLNYRKILISNVEFIKHRFYIITVPERAPGARFGASSTASSPWHKITGENEK